MTNSAILFISDIHYTNDESRSQFCKEDKNNYYQKWENYLISLEQRNGIKIKYLVITGDVVDTAKKVEYNEIENILNKLCTTLKIEKKNVLIIPGNHDINRAKLESFCDENDIDVNKASTLCDVKLQNFIGFYKNFFHVQNLDVNKAILNYIFVEELDVIIAGVNSLVKESHLKRDHVGFVDIQMLKEELEAILKEGKKNIYVATHHSFTHTGNRELATLENAEVVKETLGLLGINTFIYGHHHTSESKLDIVGDRGEEHRYIEIGSLGKVLSNDNGASYVNRFSVAICQTNELDLHDYAYTAYEWEEVNSSKYVHKLPINRTCIKEEVGNASDALPIVSNSEVELEKVPVDNDVIICQKANFLIDYLKKDNNYREGHFHWKNGKKTLGWINIEAFLGNVEILSSIKECIMDMHSQSFRDVQVVLGYGMEGNIIGSSLMDYWIENNVSYHSYPSVHKCDEHIKLEKALWNEYGEFQKVLLICDIMPTTTYLDEIIESNEKLKECSDFYVLSLFYNKNLLKGDSKDTLDRRINIHKFSLAEVNIQICELDEKECMIYKEQLKKVYTL